MNSPSEAAEIKTTAPSLRPSSSSTKDDEEMHFTITRSLPGPFFRDPESGKLTVESIFWLNGFLYFSLLFSFVVLSNSPGVALALESRAFLSFMLLLAPVCIFIQFLPVRLTIGKAGLSMLAAPERGLQAPLKKRLWENLDCVRFQKASAMSDAIVMALGRSDYLVFDWTGGGRWRGIFANTSYVNLRGLKPGDRERLFAALSRFVPQESLAPEVLYLQVKTLSGAQSNDINDYTQVWLEEYNRHFEISNYVTLPAGSKCGAGRFTVSMTIAARINSSTYLAIDSDGQKVVLKELVAPVDSDDTMQKKLLEQFNREASILAKLNHPAIVSVVDHFIENGRSYIVMQCVQGRNMREHVRLQGCLNPAEVIAIGQQLASVLQYLHHHSPPLLHRDFTPDNLIYGQNGAVTVIDFGAANVFNTGKTATLIGKQGYMPPEQLRGKPTPASDVYAYGATLCYLLTAKDMSGFGKLPPEILTIQNAGLVTLIQNCLALESEDRPTADALLASLEIMQNGAESAKG